MGVLVGADVWMMMRFACMKKKGKKERQSRPATGLGVWNVDGGDSPGPRGVIWNPGVPKVNLIWRRKDARELVTMHACVCAYVRALNYT